MTRKTDWSEYYENTKSSAPSSLLIKALGYVRQKSKAIDIGGGALKDTRYLLDQGFEVTVIDQEPQMQGLAHTIQSDQLHPIVTSFADFDFPSNEYDLASAMYALPFNSPKTFDAVVQKIKKSLVKGGIFSGQLFGNMDEWSNNVAMTFHTKDQATKLFSDMEVILLEEVEKDGKTADGSPKHWHVFNLLLDVHDLAGSCKMAEDGRWDSLSVL